MKATTSPPFPQPRFLRRAEFSQLIVELQERGYVVIGPTVDQGAIVYDRIASADEVPRGWSDIQQPGKYRLERRDDDAMFGYVVGPHSLKRFVFPPESTIGRGQKTPAGWQFSEPEDESPKFAFVGVRACELAALKVQDRVFLGGPYVDPVYQKRRLEAMVIAVNCTQAAPTCFCTSMGSGPRCTSGFDVALTELEEGFVLEMATPEGQTLVEHLETALASDEQLHRAAQRRKRAVEQIQRHLDTDGIRELLLSNLDHRHWDDVASRCLSCANCTLVCPTCFCSSVEDVADLSGEWVERRRHWDSCFHVDFSYMNGGVVRDECRTRYRQWLTHKLASWIDQFGMSGCVGCGRCITWCPVGIDLTQEVATIRG